MPTDLGFNRIVIRGEGLGLNQDLVALLGRGIEGRQESMEVGGEGVHDGNLILFGTDDASGLFLDSFFNADPGTTVSVLEMRVDGTLAPDLELFRHVAGYGLGEEAERVSTEVGAGLVGAVCA